MLFKDRDKDYAGNNGEQIIYFAYNGVIRGQFTMERTIGSESRYIYDLRIYEEYRNQGYGNLMIAEMVEQYGNYPLPLTLGVLIDNLPALHLYQKYGFKIYDDTSSPGIYWMKYEKYERN